MDSMLIFVPSYFLFTTNIVRSSANLPLLKSATLANILSTIYPLSCPKAGKRSPRQCQESSTRGTI